MPRNDWSIGEKGGLKFACGRLLKELQEIRLDHGHAEIESLEYLTSTLLKKLQLCGRLDTLGNDSQAHVPGHRNNDVDDDFAIAVGIDIVDEIVADLQLIQRQLLKGISNNPG